MKTPLDVQIAMIARLKAHADLVAALNSSHEIKEKQWQGTDFLYPAVRCESDVLPSIDGCSPDKAEIYIYVLSEDKSSKECNTVAGIIAQYLHTKSFTSDNGVKFTSVKVTKISYPRQQEDNSTWQSTIEISALVS